MRVLHLGSAMPERRADEMLRRLSTYAKADHNELKRQYLHARPVAVRCYNETAATDSLPCWDNALQTLPGDHGILERVGISVAAFGGSSSGVGQSFSIANWALEGRRSWLSDTLENDELKLIVDKRDAAEEEELFEIAQSIWCRCKFWISRASGPIRSLDGAGRADRQDRGAKSPWTTTLQQKLLSLDVAVTSWPRSLLEMPQRRPKLQGTWLFLLTAPCGLRSMRRSRTSST